MFVVMKSSNSMEKNINNDYWQTKEICTFDVGEFIDKVFSKFRAHRRVRHLCAPKCGGDMKETGTVIMID